MSGGKASVIAGSSDGPGDGDGELRSPGGLSIENDGALAGLGWPFFSSSPETLAKHRFFHHLGMEIREVLVRQHERRFFASKLSDG